MKTSFLLAAFACMAMSQASSIVPDQSVYNLDPGVFHLVVTGTVHNDSTFQNLTEVLSNVSTANMTVSVDQHIGDAGWFNGDGGLAPGGTYTGNLWELYLSSGTDAPRFANMFTLGAYENADSFGGDPYTVNASMLHSAPEPASFLALAPAALLIRRRKR